MYCYMEVGKQMSVPINCPNCDCFVTETGWGASMSHFDCPDCGVGFRADGMGRVEE